MFRARKLKIVEKIVDNKRNLIYNRHIETKSEEKHYKIEEILNQD
jgi:ATP phosphoribosyltransferase